MDELLIVGVDPGTQSAFAVLDLSGEVLKIDSARNAPIDSILREVSSLGKVVFLATDVTPAPQKVRKIARSLGVKVLEPDRNLQFHQKTKIVDEFLKKKKEFIVLKNKHEKDALCAALCSLKKLNYLLKKIEDALNQRKLNHLTKEVRQKVLLEGLPITKALRNLK